MSTIEHVLVSGQTSVDELADLLGELFPSGCERSPGRLTYGPGIQSIADMDHFGRYEDDREIVLSGYRFDVSSRLPDAAKWASLVLARLSLRQDLGLLWVTDLETVKAERRAAIPAA